MREDRVQVVRGALFVKVELAVDVIHVVHHQAHRQLGIARLNGINQLHVLIVRAMRAVAAFILGNDQRGLRHQAALKADQRSVLRRFCQLEVKFARQANTCTAITPRETVTLVLHHFAQIGEVLGSGMYNGQFGNGLFNQTPRKKHLTRFFNARAGHHCTAIGAQ